MRGLNEWGWELDFPPAVGDRIYLPHAPKDSDEYDGVWATVIGREWQLPWADNDETTIELAVRLDEQLPDAHVAHSVIWPSETWSQRKEELQRELKKIREQ